VTYPHVRVEGGPRERGRQYGEQVRERVRRSVEAYREVFAHYAGWDWERVTAEARRYAGPIAAYHPASLEEIRGIAEGAGLAEEDMLAINTRTEVMYAAKARAAAAAWDGARGMLECTSFAALPEATASGATVVGQNWDWLLHVLDTTVVLEARQDDGPDFVTVVEAGLLAKTGFTSSGLGLVTNALVTDADKGEPAVPYHVVLRAILDSETISDALAAVQAGRRSSSANYLLAHEDGIAVDVEAAPGDFTRLFLLVPEDGVLVHTNHFLAGRDLKDVSLWVMPDSPFRFERMRAAVAAERARGPLTPESFQRALADHANHPSGVCCHPDPRVHEVERGVTAASVVMDVAARRLWIADGNPCATPYRELDYAAFLAKRWPVRAAATG